MFTPVHPGSKSKKEVVRITLSSDVMDVIRAMANDTNSDTTDIIRQAVEYALASRQAPPRKSHRKSTESVSVSEEKTSSALLRRPTL